MQNNPTKQIKRVIHELAPENICRSIGSNIHPYQKKKFLNEKWVGKYLYTHIYTCIDICALCVYKCFCI